MCGVDEAGRGPLCGPVVAAAVILREDDKIEGVNDSKKLSEKKREEVYERKKKKALAVGVGMSDVEVIEELNILLILVAYTFNAPILSQVVAL